MRVALLAAGALIGFAANSLLTRGALSAGTIDPASFALVRISTGAATLALLARARQSRPPGAGTPWSGAWSLAGYLIAFTLAYTRIGASAGALLLFGSAQVTMIGTGVLRGERPRRTDWIGGGLALAGLVWLTLPGVTAPDPLGATTMIVAGVCWGAYSIGGRRSHDALGDTARNFRRATALLVLPLGWLAWPPAATATGVALGAASGALASGVAYTLWYAALPSLSPWRAATIQLAVPIVTALSAAVILNEPITPRLVAAACFVAAGVWLTTSRRR